MCACGDSDVTPAVELAPDHLISMLGYCMPNGLGIGISLLL
jgi:hypothetical protein